MVTKKVIRPVAPWDAIAIREAAREVLAVWSRDVIAVRSPELLRALLVLGLRVEESGASVAVPDGDTVVALEALLTEMRARK